jgi:hypothetical protein
VALCYETTKLGINVTEVLPFFNIYVIRDQDPINCSVRDFSLRHRIYIAPVAQLQPIGSVLGAVSSGVKHQENEDTSPYWEYRD